MAFDIHNVRGPPQFPILLLECKIVSFRKSEKWLKFSSTINEEFDLYIDELNPNYAPKWEIIYQSL